MHRRDFLKTSAGAAVLASLPRCGDDADKWDAAAFRKQPSSKVAILRADRYDGALTETVLTGLRLFPLEVSNRRVVLKPNFVEFDPDGVINTHPAVLTAAIEAFRILGALEVVVAEGPGHRRDNQYLLSASGIGAALLETGTRYFDLNTDAVRRVPLRSRFTGLRELYLPETVLGADLLVSIPKMKTHHWAGVTLSLKNMFGVVPGAVYGWPKNLLHWAGIGGSILDINAALAMPRFNIIDGIVGMEGNGPIQGEARQSGVLVFGSDPVAVDATCARLMRIDPWKIGYLETAGAFLGNVADEKIEQIGEDLDVFQQDYRVLESFQRIKAATRMTAG
ncbi:MAG TPA: DUF362 domain-containing protein [Gemmatimonadota bacterium]|nr:DUF362 domain-containing protein [Gemmatimonadota bacterium]